MDATAAVEADIDDERLPAEYDTLVPVDQLIHGSQNPRRVSPSPDLRASIAQSGLHQPLIVRPAEDHDHPERYHVTDGWQRYQAATDCGWEVLPVRIFDSPLAALKATETASIVREWSTYEWATYCQSIATELTADSDQKVIEEVAERTTKSTTTISRYLDVLSLPEAVHLLLIDGPDGAEQDWAALRNYNPDVRRYDGLPWTVAAYLGRRQSTVSTDRIIGIAALAVQCTTSEEAIEFIKEASESPDKPLDLVQKEVQWGQKHSRMLEVPRTVVSLDCDQKRAIMEYCRKNRHSLRDVVGELLTSFAAETEYE